MHRLANNGLEIWNLPVGDNLILQARRTGKDHCLSTSDENISCVTYCFKEFEIWSLTDILGLGVAISTHLRIKRFIQIMFIIYRVKWVES